MPTYKEYMQQIEHLTILAEAARAEEIKEAKEQIQQIMRDTGISAADLADTAKAGPKRKHPPSTVLYKDPESGKTWTGRGRAPGWLEGKNRDDFLVK
jgi:DNA-binding protein H-NS